MENKLFTAIFNYEVIDDLDDPILTKIELKSTVKGKYKSVRVGLKLLSSIFEAECENSLLRLQGLSKVNL